jgi:PAS domain S-box-containing protein
MFERLVARLPAALIKVAPAAVLLALSALTALVWRDQLAQQHLSLVRHTEDIAVQSAQRLQDLIEGDLRIAGLMARRWVQGDDRSHERFAAFANLLTGDLRVLSAVALLDNERQALYVQPDDPSVAAALSGDVGGRLAEELAAGADVAVSGIDPESGPEAGFYALLPVDNGNVRTGYLAVHFHADALVRQSFHEQILEEFDVRVTEGPWTLFQSTQTLPPPTIRARLLDALNPSPRVSVELEVRQRQWELSMQPLESAKMATWSSNLAVVTLGMLSAAALSAAAYLLLQRMRKYQRARDEALAQIAERQRVEQALRSSEARYRDVFASATDALLVVDRQGCVLEANAAAEALAAIPSPSMLGRELGELFGASCAQYCAKLLAGEAAHERFETSISRADGERLDIEVRATLLKQDASARLLVVVTDVTQRKRALERHAMLSRKVLLAQEEERARVARELHDELGQILTAIRLEMGWFKKRIDADSEVDMDMFHEAVKLIERAADESRRICRGLRPPLLDDLGLEPAVRLLVEEFEEHAQVETSLALDVDESVHVPREFALCTYRIVQEALTNIGRHAHAKHAEVRLCVSEGRLELELADDGVGFDPARRHGTGIEGMSERANLVNGTLSIHASPGGGTRVSFVVTLAVEEKELSA